jgi:membrane-bound lytic murein transglycosylase A
MLKHFLALTFLVYGANLYADDFTTPTKIVKESISFEDDLDFDWLDIALNQQIYKFENSNLTGNIKLGKTNYPRIQLLSSLKLFKDLINEARACILNSPLEKPGCLADFNQEVTRNFNVYTPDILPTDPEASRPSPALFTAYYSPDFIGSRIRTEKYRYGIYALPSESELRSLTREAIDFDDALEGKGYTLFYVENLFDLYLMHIEGGGRVSVQNEKGVLEAHYLSYAGANGKPLKFVSNIMVEMGLLPPGKNSTTAQRNYLAQHPEKAREIFQKCPSYIFFKITDHPPLGVDNIPLTDNRSIATDRKLYPQKGLISYIVAKRPIQLNDGTIKNIPFSRFFLDQDTGGAIKGKARADLYFGFGPEAEVSANNLTQFGNIYFLMEKMVKVTKPSPAPTVTPQPTAVPGANPIPLPEPTQTPTIVPTAFL